MSAHIPVKMEGAPKLVTLLEGECPVIWILIPRSRSQKSWDNMTDLVVPVVRQDTRWQGCCGNEKFCKQKVGRQYQDGNACMYASKKLLISLSLRTAR